MKPSAENVLPKRTLKESFLYPMILILVMWGIAIAQSQFNLEITQFGVYPRKASGLLGILTSPFIHADYAHLLSNSVPFLVLGTIVVYFYRKVAVPVFLLIFLLTGVAVWLLGRPTYHVGASGVVYGLVAFVFWTGIFRKNPIAIVLSLIVILLYSGMFLGVLPDQPGVSWESHLFGSISGIFCALLFKEEIEEMEDRVVYSWEREGETEGFFLHRDTFDKTLAQREREKRDQLGINNPYGMPSNTWRNNE